MSACCDHDCAPVPPSDHAFRRALWAALVINATMFVVEIAAGLFSGSAALKADALDFFGDASNLAISLFALGLAGAWTSRAALLKGATMGGFGLYILGDAAAKVFTGAVPEPATMGIVGCLALAANVGSAVLLYRHRSGDANRRSAWLCSRNDAIGNVAVLIAAGTVSLTGTGWPDVIVAAVMAGLELTSARAIIVHALAELRRPQPAAAE
jgi:cation diffusion facilitator family transporter